jgi:hypothetical protein
MITMKRQYTVTRCEYVSKRAFEEVVTAFEAAVGDADDGPFTTVMNAVQSATEWESLANSLFGLSGVMHVLKFDNGHWLRLYGSQGKAEQYMYGVREGANWRGCLGAVQ